MKRKFVEGPAISPEISNYVDLSLGEYFLETTKSFLDKVSMIEAESERSLTYREMIEKSNTIGSSLSYLNCNRGSAIAIVSGNCLEFPCIVLAAFFNGVTCACVNSHYSADELRHAFAISRPKVVFASNAKYDLIKKLQIELPFIEVVINIEKDDYKIKRRDQFEITSTDSKPEDVATILYSSGSTGLSKGVRTSHRNYIYLFELYKRHKIFGFFEGYVSAAILPMSHCYGLFTVLMGLTQGHTCVVIKQYSKLTILDYVQKYRINNLYLVPSIVIAFSKDPDVFNYDLSSVRRTFCAGEKLKKEIAEKFKTCIKSSKFVQFYGMTETTGGCIVPPSDEKPETIGQLLPGMQAKIIDLDDGSTLGPHQMGELCIKGVLLMDGYCQTDTFHEVGFDADGWLHSGDVAFYDNDFYFHVVDRVKELIKYKSFQVPPIEIETFLLSLETVENAGVIGISDEEAGELPRAYVVKKAGYEYVTEAHLKQLVAENLSPQKHLRGGVVFVDKIPQTANGKLNRKKLKNWAVKSIE